MTKDSEPRAAKAPPGPAATAAAGLAIYALTKVAAALLAQLAMAAFVAQAVIADWGLGRVGVTWSDPAGPEPTAGTISRRAGVGAGVGAAIALLLTSMLALTGGALFPRGDAPGLAIAYGLVSAGFLAMRDELLLRGLPLRVVHRIDARPAKLVACAVTSAAAALSAPDANVRTVSVAALLGAVSGALWLRDRGAWQAWGATAALNFATSTLLQGVVFDARVARNPWGGADSGLLGGWAAVAAVLPFALAAVAWAARPAPPPPS